MHSDAKKPLSGSTVNSQVLLVFSHIIGSKYENGLPCDLFLAETQPPSFLEHSFHGIPGDSPEILRKLSVYEKFITKEFRQKAGILRCERMENIRFRKNMIILSTIILSSRRIKS